MGLVIEGLGKSYFPEQWVVRDVNLEIATGELFALLGPSGAGKSTILRIVAGVEVATEGRLLLDGRYLNALQPEERDMAMVFQDLALYPNYTVRRNIGFPLKVRGIRGPELDLRVMQMARTLLIEPLLDRRPRQLSGGEQQRVALGRALVRHPRLLLLDEPLGSLDVRLREQIRLELRRLHSQMGVTTLLVTHDQLEALSLADRLAVIDQGRIHQVGTPQEIYERPASLFVAMCVGSPAINLFHATLTGDGQVCLWPGECSACVVICLEEPFGSSGSRTIVLGVRPEHFRVHRKVTPNTIAARVIMVQYGGSQLTMLAEACDATSLFLGEKPVVVTLQPECVPTAGESVWLEPIMKGALVFDAHSGQNLRPGGCWARCNPLRA